MFLNIKYKSFLNLNTFVIKYTQYSDSSITIDKIIYFKGKTHMDTKIQVI